MSPEKDGLSPVDMKDLSIESTNSGDRSNSVMEDKKEGSDSDSNIGIRNECITCPKPSDPQIGHNPPYYYCRQHPNVQNIHLEEIEHHIKYSKVHSDKRI